MITYWSASDNATSLHKVNHRIWNVTYYLQISAQICIGGIVTWTVLYYLQISVQIRRYMYGGIVTWNVIYYFHISAQICGNFNLKCSLQISNICANMREFIYRMFFMICKYLYKYAGIFT